MANAASRSATERPIDGFLHALRSYDLTYRQTAPEGRWEAQCPAHEDRYPSLRITEKEDGRLLVHCFRGCGTESVLAVLGLDWTDLFPDGMKKKTYCPTCGKPM